MRRLQERGLTDSYDLLTEREKETLQLVAEGKSNKDIAKILNVGVSTVESHRTNMMEKLGLHGTVDIILYAVRKRIISAN
jgi:DNA-binding CsgD family transcriptional regulator